MADYALPPWLKPVDTASPYASGLALGARIAEERNRLQAQAQQAQMEATVRQAEAQRRALREQQEIEMEKQRIQIEQGLRKTALDQAQQKIDFTVQKAAQRSMAQAKYRDLINSGVDPAQALLQVGPDLGTSMTGAAQLYKATRPPAGPASVEQFDGHPFLRIPTVGGNTRYQQIKEGAGALPSEIQGIPVRNPYTGKVEPTMMGVPTGSGGATVRNIPDRTLRIAQQRLKQMESDPGFGTYLQTDRVPAKRDGEKKDDYQKRLDTFNKVKAQYGKLRAIVDGAMEGPPDELAAGITATPPATGNTFAAPYPEGTVLNHKDGSKWIVQNGRPVPYSPQDRTLNVSPPHDEEPAPDESEEDPFGDGF